MSSEKYNQIIDDAYKNYRNKASMSNDLDCLVRQEDGSFLKEMRLYTQESFINKCKTDPEFSEKWGLKIEERELSREERYVWYKANTHLIPPHFRNQEKEFEDKYVPTKLIILTYNNETVEIYE